MTLMFAAIQIRPTNWRSTFITLQNDPKLPSYDTW